jgi:hypothetical protein
MLHNEPQGNRAGAARRSSLETLNGHFLAVVEHAKIVLPQSGEERFGIRILLRGRGNNVDENCGRRLGSHRPKRVTMQSGAAPGAGQIVEGERDSSGADYSLFRRVSL